MIRFELPLTIPDKLVELAAIVDEQDTANSTDFYAELARSIYFPING